MPATKAAFQRYLLIHRELSTMRIVSAIELRRMLQRELGVHISSRTLQADIRTLRQDDKLQFHAPIVRTRKEGLAAYRYGKHYSMIDQLRKIYDIR